MSKWLTLIGVGDDGLPGLTPAARAALDAAEIVVGSERVLGEAPPLDAETHLWTCPLSDMLARIEGWRGRRVAVLATGDPMHYGVGVTLLRHLAHEEITVLPAPSAFSLAAARLGWPLQDVETLSLHARPVALLQAFLAPGARLIALTGGASTVHEVAAQLADGGYGRSRLTVLEHMGGADERQMTFEARACNGRNFAEFNTLAIDCKAEPGAPLRPRVPGLPDDAFAHDGQLTKREIRAITVAALAPTPGALLWDVGAGCGSVAIEWMRAAPGARAIAFERKPERLAMIAENASALGTPDLDSVPGELPGTFDGQPQPDAIFIGGGVSNPAIFDACWAALPAGGRMVANAVTLEGETAVVGFHGRHGGELVRMDVAHVTQVGAFRGMEPRMAVMQWRTTKE